VLPSVDVLGLVALETLKVSVPTLFEAARGTVTTQVCNDRLDSWSKHLITHIRMAVEVTGRDNVDASESYVVMSNHQSHLDIPVLFQAVGVPLRMVAKTELFKIPVMSRAMRVAGFVEVDRRDRQRAIESLRAVREQLNQSLSIWIAPEGTRSRTGRLASFKKVGFHMALDLGLRILPVTINGTRNALPADGLHVTRDQRIEVIVGRPIDAPSFGPDRRDELVATVRAAIHENLWPEYQGADPE
jgi:1-acyl-sn-glycerol-3-phosphate acyltransferase